MNQHGLEIWPIGLVVGGRREPTDDYWTGTAIIRLNEDYPRGNSAWRPTGTFVLRNHRRPNQLAQSFPRLLKVNGLDLHVTDLDAIDGTARLRPRPVFSSKWARGGR